MPITEHKVWKEPKPEPLQPHKSDAGLQQLYILMLADKVHFERNRA
jgi:hypothetical protein